MGFSFNFFGKQEVRRFNYRPRFYDPEEEERREMFGDHSKEKKEYVPGELVRGSLRDGNHKSTKEVSRNQKHLGMLTIVLLFAVVAAIFKYFPILMESYESARKPTEVHYNFYEDHKLCSLTPFEKDVYKAFWKMEETTLDKLKAETEAFYAKYRQSPFVFAEREQAYMEYWDNHGLPTTVSVRIEDLENEFLGRFLLSPLTSATENTVLIDVIEPSEDRMKYEFICNCCNEKASSSVDEWESAEW